MRLRVVAPAAVALVTVSVYVWDWNDQIGELRDHYDAGYAAGVPLLKDPSLDNEGQRECWTLTLDRYGVDTLDERGADEPRVFWSGCLDAVTGGEPNRSSTHLEDILRD